MKCEAILDRCLEFNLQVATWEARKLKPKAAVAKAASFSLGKMPAKA
jgi:hypothetical protein